MKEAGGSKQTMDLTVVALVTFAVVVLYVVERYTRQKPIDTVDALKLGGLSAAITGGVLYTVAGAGVDVPTVASAVEAAQEMFIGKPSF